MGETEAAKADEEKVKAVAERLSFFFSDANIRQDKFVRYRILGDESDYPHQLTVECLLKFNTIKKISEDEAVVVAAAKSLDFLNVSEDGKAIGRVKPFTKDDMDKNLPLTLYVSGLPVNRENNCYDCRLDDLRGLFQQYGDIAITKFRFKLSDNADDADYDYTKASEGSPRKSRRTPIGDALVEFKDEASLKKAVDDTLTTKEGEVVEPKRKLKVGENELQVQTLLNFISMKKKRKHDSKEKDEKGEEKEPVVNGEDLFNIDWKKGCVINVKGLSEDCDREALVAAVAKALEISESEVKDRKVYMDYSRGQPSGAIRFSESGEEVSKVCKLLAEGEAEVAGKKVESAVILEGEEESTYWTNFIDWKRKSIMEKNQKRGSHKKRRRDY